MKQINLMKKESENEIIKPFKLLGNKTKRFKIINKADNNKVLSSENLPETKFNEGRWSYDEQLKFIIGISKDGTNWKKIKNSISTRSLAQIRSHAQKFYNRLKLCKCDKLGIDFTSDEIQGIKDMIHHIRSINKNYDIAKIFLFFSNKLNIENKEEKSTDENYLENFSKEENENENSLNKEEENFPQVLNGNNNLDVNKILLLNYINNFNNYNLFTPNYLSNSPVANNYLTFIIYMNYLQSLKSIPQGIQQPCLFNGIGIIPDLSNNLSNNVNINKFK